jgi:hypothetical protein
VGSTITQLRVIVHNVSCLGFQGFQVNAAGGTVPQCSPEAAPASPVVPAIPPMAASSNITEELISQKPEIVVPPTTMLPLTLNLTAIQNTTLLLNSTTIFLVLNDSVAGTIAGSLTKNASTFLLPVLVLPAGFDLPEKFKNVSISCEHVEEEFCKKIDDPCVTQTQQIDRTVTAVTLSVVFSLQCDDTNNTVSSGGLSQLQIIVIVAGAIVGAIIVIVPVVAVIVRRKYFSFSMKVRRLRSSLESSTSKERM